MTNEQSSREQSRDSKRSEEYAVGKNSFDFLHNARNGKQSVKHGSSARGTLNLSLSTNRLSDHSSRIVNAEKKSDSVSKGWQ